MGVRAAPRVPLELQPQALTGEYADDPAVIRTHQNTERRRARALAHYVSLRSEMDAAPEGILAALSWAYALMTEAGEVGAVPEFLNTAKAYIAGRSKSVPQRTVVQEENDLVGSEWFGEALQ